MILVSAGHHYLAKGATFNNVSEFDITPIWRNDLVRSLGHVASVVPSGLLRDKVDFINRAEPALVIEIHFNSSINMRGQHVGKGCETMYKPNDHRSRHAAMCLQEAMATVFQPSRGSFEGWLRRDYPGRVDYQGDVEGDEHLDYLLANATCPAVIVEPEFIHNLERINRNQGLAILEMSNALTGLMKDWDV